MARLLRPFLCVTLLSLSATITAAQDFQVTTRPDIEYVQHDGAALAGDLYLPKGRDKAPIVVAIHGGGWQNGNRSSWKHWGPFLAKNGYAVFAISYRLGKPGIYPAAVYDGKAAIQFVRAQASELGVDPDRIGLMGDSAGGHLVALLGLAAEEFKSEYRDDKNAAIPAGVKSVIGFYGVYDMLAQWQHDQIARPRDQITEKFLGQSPMQSKKIYFDSSPISYTTIDRNKARFLLINGTNDDIVDPAQGVAFWTALNQAGTFARRIIVPGAGHFFASDPFEDEPNSYNAQVAPRLLRFLGDAL
jgi:acetyl esterase/lipase